MGLEIRSRCDGLLGARDVLRSATRAWRPDQRDLALDRGIYNRNACAQLRRVFIYVRQADGHLCPPERDQSDYVGKGQIVARRKAPDPHF
jgi:hypothetical protein